ncbi:hypothetical protein L3Q82_026296, partial [Scortum barcoo]
DSNTNSVLQTPPFIIKRTGESVTSEIKCSHKTTSFNQILCYKQDEHKALKLLGYLNVDTPYPEDDVKEKISFDGDGSKASNLTVSNLSLNDSGVYFCAASQHSAADSPQVNTKTLLHLSADRRHVQALQHLQPPYKPALKILSTSTNTKLFMVELMEVMLPRLTRFEMVSAFSPGDTNSVLQTPPFIIKRTGESVTREINCSHKITSFRVLLNTGKTKELIVDFRRNADPHTPIHIKGMTVERVNSFKFLGVHISEDLTWTTGCSKLVKKAHQRLFFLRTLRKNHLSSDILVNFYRCTIESILTSCITVWYGSCSAADRKALQRVVKAAQRIAGAPLPSIEDIYRKRCLKRAGKIIKDSSHPAHRLFTLLPSGKRYRSARTKITRFLNSFFPTAVRLLNSVS